MKWLLLVSLAAAALLLLLMPAASLAKDLAPPTRNGEDTSSSASDKDIEGLTENVADKVGNDTIRWTSGGAGGITCPIFEEFRDCPEAHTCQTTCATLNYACVIQPTCTPACFCKAGFARDANNRCVPISRCPGESDML